MNAASGLPAPAAPVGPGLPDDVLPRQRLLRHAGDLAAPGVTLVVAPAGYGKTTLLAGWAAAAPCRVAWVSLASTGLGPDAFAIAVIAGIRQVIPAFGESILARLRFSPEPDAIGRALATEFAALTAPLVLVLDDYHEAANQGADTLLAAALREIAPSLRVVISSRVEPGFSLARLRASGMLSEFGPDALLFTREESAAFLRQYGDASHEEWARWWVSAGGWPVALRLLTTAMRERTDGEPPAVEPMLSLHRTLRDFLIDEVLDRQPPERRDHLLRLALPDRVDHALCAALCDLDDAGASALLERLIFVDRLLTPGEGGQASFHALVRGIFRDELSARFSPERLAALNTTTALAMERSGDIESAIGHLRAAGDDDGAVALAERHVWQVVDLDRRELIDRWLRALPPERVASSPELLLGRASWQLMRGNDHALKQTLAAVEHVLAAEPERWPEQERDRMQGVADVLRLSSGLFERMDDPTAALEAARMAEARLGPGRSTLHAIAVAWQGFMIHLLGDTEGAIAMMRQALLPESAQPDAMTVAMQVALCNGLTVGGYPHRAIAEAREAGRISAAMGLPSPDPWLSTWQGVSHLLRLEPALAADALQSAWAVRSRLGSTEARESALGLALSLWLLGSRSEGLALLDTFLAEAEGAHDATWWAAALSMRARLMLLDGDLPGARAWMHQYETMDVIQPGMVVIEEPALTAFQIAIARGGERAAEAADALPAAIAHYDARRDLANGIRARVLLALARKAAHAPAPASLQPLREAADLAEPTGILLPFAEHRLTLARMLRQAGPAAARIADTIDSAPVSRATSPRAIPRPLTHREQEILDALRDGLTRKEIAEQLSISPATAKRHISKVYEKLGVEGKMAAIATANAAAPRHPSSGAVADA